MINNGITRIGGGDSTTILPHKQRSSNIELYRIIVMLLIVAHHYVVNSGLLEPIRENPLSNYSIFYYLFGAWGKTGINCFVLITGYFMCTNNISLRKFLKLYIWIVFYSVVILLIFALTGYQNLSVKNLLVLLPFRIVHSDNFEHAFLVWWLFIPFLNLFINTINRIQHLKIILLMFTVFSIYSFVPKILMIDVNPVCWFSTLYFIASYIRKYPKYIPNHKSARLWGWMSVILIALGMLSIYVIVWIGSHIGKQLPQYYMLADSQQPLSLAISIATFMYFKNLKIRANKIINTIAASSFGVLLIHANSDTMRQWLWKDTIDCVGHYDAPYYWLYAIGCVLVIYAICTVIDIVRIKTIETPLLNATETLCLNVYNKINRK